MPIFSYLQNPNLVFVLSLSLSLTAGSSFSDKDLCRRPLGPSRLSYHAEAPPPRLCQHAHPRRAQLDPLERRGRLLRH
jgi:hypothetical protein